jgi:hypothetical protein
MKRAKRRRPQLVTRGIQAAAWAAVLVVEPGAAEVQPLEWHLPVQVEMEREAFTTTAAAVVAVNMLNWSQGGQPRDGITEQPADDVVLLTSYVGPKLRHR